MHGWSVNQSMKASTGSHANITLAAHDNSSVLTGCVCTRASSCLRYAAAALPATALVCAPWAAICQQIRVLCDNQLHLS
jgi:hypothetical protein